MTKAEQQATGTTQEQALTEYEIKLLTQYRRQRELLNNQLQELRDHLDEINELLADKAKLKLYLGAVAAAKKPSRLLHLADSYADNDTVFQNEAHEYFYNEEDELCHTSKDLPLNLDLLEVAKLISSYSTQPRDQLKTTLCEVTSSGEAKVKRIIKREETAARKSEAFNDEHYGKLPLEKINKLSSKQTKNSDAYILVKDIIACRNTRELEAILGNPQYLNKRLASLKFFNSTNLKLLNNWLKETADSSEFKAHREIITNVLNTDLEQSWDIDSSPEELAQQILATPEEELATRARAHYLSAINNAQAKVNFAKGMLLAFANKPNGIYPIIKNHFGGLKFLCNYVKHNSPNKAEQRALSFANKEYAAMIFKNIVNKHRGLPEGQAVSKEINREEQETFAHALAVIAENTPSKTNCHASQFSCANPYQHIIDKGIAILSKLEDNPQAQALLEIANPSNTEDNADQATLSNV
jgi:hypothetical protein